MSKSQEKHQKPSERIIDRYSQMVSGKGFLKNLYRRVALLWLRLSAVFNVVVLVVAELDDLDERLRKLEDVLFEKAVDSKSFRKYVAEERRERRKGVKRGG